MGLLKYDLIGKTGLKIDLGCGENKQKGFLGMDLRDLPGVDIVHDIEQFPWPIPQDSCRTVIASHLIEHIKPWYSIPFMDECWRIMEPGGQLALSTPYPGSRGFWQDPTHCNGWNEATFQYFDPKYPLYYLYQPKPWEIVKGFPVYQSNGNLEVVLEKILPSEKIEEKLPDLGVSIAEEIQTTEHLA